MTVTPDNADPRVPGPGEHVRRMFATFDAKDVPALAACYIDATPVYA
jgi:hypothetical protein